MRSTTILTCGVVAAALACSDSPQAVAPELHTRRAEIVLRADGPHLVGPTVVFSPGLPTNHAPGRARVLAQGTLQPWGECGRYQSTEFYGARPSEPRRVFTIAEYDRASCAAVFLLGDWQPIRPNGSSYDSVRAELAPVLPVSSTVIAAQRSLKTPPCSGVPDFRAATNKAWIAANSDGTEILRDEIRLTWAYTYYCIQDAELVHFCAWQTSYNLFPGSSDQQGYYVVTDGYITQVEARSFCGVRRNCPSPMSGYNEMSIGFGLGVDVSNLVRGFYDGSAVGERPPFGINVPGSSCVIYSTGFWEPPPPIA
jgi:hypothetical protein